MTTGSINEMVLFTGLRRLVFSEAESLARKELAPRLAEDVAQFIWIVRTRRPMPAFGSIRERVFGRGDRKSDQLYRLKYD